MKKHSQLVLRILLVVLFLGAGIWLRSLQATRTASGESGWRPWATTSAVTLYFHKDGFLFPVTRRIRGKDDLPLRALQALMAGPRSSTGLKNLVPGSVQIRSFSLENGIAHIDLSAIPDGNDAEAAQSAIVETMTSLGGVTSVEVSVEGKPLGAPSTRTPLLYFASASGLVAIPVMAANPRDALQMYLSGPPAPELTGLPADVRLLAHEYNSADRLLSLKFSYTPSLRALAMDRPERMRTVLLGLIATLTEFPEIRTVQLDFGGQTRLGLGQCSDLLRTPQRRPTLLNDERLL